MLEKITIERFNQIKEELTKKIEEVQKRFEEIEKTEPSQEESERIQYELIGEYEKVQNQIFNYDLSDIPFEAWEDVIIFFTKEIDLSNCKVNFDFRLLEFSTQAPVNFKNCNLRNIDYATGLPLLQDYLPEEVIDNNPNFFLSDIFSEDMKDKFARHVIKIEDLTTLTEQQIEELETKGIKDAFDQQEYKYYIGNIFKSFGIKKTLEIYKDKTFFSDIQAIFESALYDIKESVLANAVKESLNIKEMKNKVYDLLIKVIKENGIYDRNYNRFSQDFRDRYPEFFPPSKEIPEDVINRYYRSELTLQDLKEHSEKFGNIDLSSYTKIPFAYGMTDLKLKLGINFQKLVVSDENTIRIVFEELDNDYSVRYKFYELFNELYEKENNLPIEEIKNILVTTLLKSKFGDTIEFAKVESNDIYKDANYPEWVQELGYYASKMTSAANNDFMFLLTSKTEIACPNLKKIFDILGYENIKKFFKENNFFKSEVLAQLDTIELGDDITPTTSYEDFLKKLVHIASSYKTESYRKNYIAEELGKLEGPISEIASSITISKDAPDDLKHIFYNNNFSYEYIIQHKEWIPYVKHLSLEKLKIDLKINSYNSKLPDVPAVEDTPFAETYLRYGTMEGLLNLLRNYPPRTYNYSYLSVDVGASSLAEFESSFRKSVKERILTGGSFSENLPQEFKDEFKDMFLSDDAPDSLKWQFYGKYLTLDSLKTNIDWLDYLENIDLRLISGIPQKFMVSNMVTGIEEYQTVNELYIDKYGQKDFLKFLVEFSPLSRELEGATIFLYEESKKGFENALEDVFAKRLTSGKYIFTENMPENFKNKYSNYFLSPDAPQELKNAYYGLGLDIDIIHKNPSWVDYLENIPINFIKGIPSQIQVTFDAPPEKHGDLIRKYGEEGTVIYNQIRNSAVMNLSEFYIKKFGQKDFLNYIAKYGRIFSELRHTKFHIPDPVTKETFEENMDRTIIDLIKRGQTYEENYPSSFKEKYNTYFLNPNAPQELKDAFYSRTLTITLLSEHPEYYEYLRNKDLASAFVKQRFNLLSNDRYTNADHVVSQLLEHISLDNLIDLLKEYGYYLVTPMLSIELFKAPDFETLKKQLEAGIVEAIKKGDTHYDDKAPQFLKDALPNYFLSDNAPEELKRFYYHLGYEDFNYTKLNDKEKEWLPFIKGKSIIPCINQIRDYNLRSNHFKYIKLFGEDKAFNYGIKRTSIVDAMINSGQVELMYNWWQKTGCKFIPDTVIMLNFPFEEADKFLAHGKDWSSLMRNKRFSTTLEGRDAMLKLAYAFGTFDSDNRGIKQLDSLLNDIPKKLSVEDYNILNKMETDIISSNSNSFLLGEEEYKQLESVMKSEGLNPDEKSILKTFYRELEDGSYILKVNFQEYPKTRELLRTFMEKNNISCILSPTKAHTMLGSMKMKYDKEFREFFLAHADKFITDKEYGKYLPAIHENFLEIKVANSNRVLTPELAISFVQENKYSGIEIGNEELGRVSSIAGYSQNDFNILQEIYNLGKTRVTNSIPRVSGKVGRFNYEMLALTDPLAVAIGTLTDCCQEINNAAAGCMEHSMISNHGRLFLITDEEGNYVSQSWVWRNGDVICFDNVEIPDKQLLKSGMPRHLVGTGTRNEFTDEILAIYKRAAEELMEEDERVYKELLEQGKITQEQYDGLRLGKVTVGEGYNDIKASVQAQYQKDRGDLARPQPFKPVVQTNSYLYTNDSTTQYVLTSRPDRKQYKGETPTVHYDKMKVYDYTNFGERQLLTLKKLELQTDRSTYQLNTTIEEIKPDKIVEELSMNYGTSYDKTRIILNPNFAIVYEDGVEIRLADVLTNKLLNEKQKQKTKLQLKFALLQLQQSGKKINVNNLEPSQRKLINEILEIQEEVLDEERGISHGTK